MLNSIIKVFQQMNKPSCGVNKYLITIIKCKINKNNVEIKCSV